MEVILLERVVNLGNLGSKVKVKNGFARNFLIPQGKAIRATTQNIVSFEERRAELEKKEAILLGQAQERAKTLTGLTVQIHARASDEGKLFGSVSTREIAHALMELGHEVHRSAIILPEGVLRSVGEYEIALHLHSDVHQNILVNVQAEK